MKIRIIYKNKLYYPQYFGQTYWSKIWKNFFVGTKHIRFIAQEDAKDFLGLIASVCLPIKQSENTKKIVFQDEILNEQK